MPELVVGSHVIYHLQSKKEKYFFKLCHTWDTNFQYSNPESKAPWGEWSPLVDDLLTPCAGTVMTKAFTIYKRNGD